MKPQANELSSIIDGRNFVECPRPTVGNLKFGTYFRIYSDSELYQKAGTQVGYQALHCSTGELRFIEPTAMVIPVFVTLTIERNL